jgi:hypothetical protein
MEKAPKRLFFEQKNARFSVVFSPCDGGKIQWVGAFHGSILPFSGKEVN